MRGRFITLEGVDGAGKSTFIRRVEERIRARGHEVLATREPGGTVLGERLRELLLSVPMRPETEALLVFGARREHVCEVLEPALARGCWVVCDRFTDATYAYQGSGRGVPPERLQYLAEWVHAGLRPDLTLLFDTAVAVARSRSAAARTPDRFEAEKTAFFERVREGYLSIARAHPARVVVIDGGAGIEAVGAQVDAALERLWS